MYLITKTPRKLSRSKSARNRAKLKAKNTRRKARINQRSR